MDHGIVVGCDQRLEWILPWWWKHYSAHNHYPVAFFDFGMSEKGRIWCSKRGQLYALNSANPISTLQQEISWERRILWESQYGKGVWLFRTAWLQKPLALAQSPFSVGLWLDLDCRVDGNLSPVFDLLQGNDDFGALKYENNHSSLDHPNGETYNSGVIVFKQQAPLLKQWVKRIIEFPDELPSDEDYLNQTIQLCRPKIVLLPPIYNWSRKNKKNPQALIVHFHGGEGKITLLKEIGPARFQHLLD